ncbi:dTDP-4-dehydrorhamnose 3,5-epimerase [Eubacterium oxidoreducens]|uniref:dTDP-4-dehydrorhamnose 3,5-epimerase n=1 Tax=Eubacterium oxidoreducens TaxID=1732 RepID=A0A1G6CB31_EUBOX|nr:dTDP-4-dehydrorhamnose 3,5-epimerase [Eubacterium oxidoreducens]SDB30107.1 dTDP-4-dehydrorhamnose 3,5-epimerase [Eubacterium oxidoreducens]
MGEIQVEKDVGGIKGLSVITPKVYGDSRGYFVETYNKKDLQDHGLMMEFVQDNQSKSVKGVLRGLHFQIHHPQGKLVRVTKGVVYDVAVDLRADSESYGKWYGIELSESNFKQLYIPEGFAHGFLVLSKEAEFSYKCTDFYHPGDEGGIAWNDPKIGINWPGLYGIYQGDAKAEGYHLEDGTPLILSEKDERWDGIDDYEKSLSGNDN